jgi:hypothetical protein
MWGRPKPTPGCSAEEEEEEYKRNGVKSTVLLYRGLHDTVFCFTIWLNIPVGRLVSNLVSYSECPGFKCRCEARLATSSIVVWHCFVFGRYTGQTTEGSRDSVSIGAIPVPSEPIVHNREWYINNALHKMCLNKTKTINSWQDKNTAVPNKYTK